MADEVETLGEQFKRLQEAAHKLRTVGAPTDDTLAIELSCRWRELCADPAFAEYVLGLEQIAGLQADPKMRQAVKEHLQSEYGKRKPDSSFSQVHRIYETGCALMGPSLVVDWHDKQVWFSPCGDSVEVEEYPKEKWKKQSDMQDALATATRRADKLQSQLAAAQSRIAALEATQDQPHAP